MTVAASRRHPSVLATDAGATGHSGHPRPGRMLWVSAVWGACFVTIRWGLRDAPVLWFAALRALVAGFALLGVATVHGRPKPTGGRVWLLISLMAVTNASIGFAAMFAGVNGLATGTAAVLTNAQPLLVLRQQNTQLTELTKQLTERVEALTKEMHDHFVKRDGKG